MCLGSSDLTRPGAEKSYYEMSAGPAPLYPAFEGEHSYDLCVIGGGYTGLSAALHAAQRGLSVCLLEAHTIGFGASGRNGGQLLSGQRISQDVLERRLGQDKAQALWRLSEDAKGLAKGLIREHAIDCALGRGHLIAAVKRSHARDLQAYADHLSTAYGYKHAQYVPKAELSNYVASDHYFGGLYDSDAAHLHPLSFAYGLAKAAESTGAMLFQNSAALRIRPGPEILVEAQHGRVHARFAVLACDSYLGALFPPIAPYTVAIHAFVGATEPLGDLGLALIPANCAVADTAEVLDYYRLSRDGRLIFGGGESAGVPDPAGMAESIRRRMLRIFPRLRGVALDSVWSGRIALTAARLPHAGRAGRNLLFAQGFSGQGVAIATHMGWLMAEAMSGNSKGFDVYASLKTHRFFLHGWTQTAIAKAALLWGNLKDRVLP